MEEEEEVDIVGDFTDREIFDGQILTIPDLIHPQWLVDNVHGSDNWTDKHGGKTVELSEINELEWPSEDNVTNDILIFDQDIPTVVEEEVVMSQSDENDEPEIESISKNKILTYPRSLLKHSKKPHVKFKTSVYVERRLFETKSTKRSKLGKKLKTNLKHVKLKKNHKIQSRKDGRHKHKLDYGENITIYHEEKQGSGVIKEEIIRIEKQTDEDSDLEIDIEFNDDELKLGSKIGSTSDLHDNKSECDKTVKLEERKSLLNFNDIEPNIRVLLEDDQIPLDEIKIQPDHITELEKFIHSEFFENRPTKTVQRYLRIRNHITNCWRNSKPNYVSKTTARSGLKNCGDVNCISRIHLYLEQLGVINFGHNGEYFNYIRPLKKILGMLSPKYCPTVKTDKSQGHTLTEKRFRKRSLTSSYLLESVTDKRIDTKAKKKNEFELVKCEKHSSLNSAPFCVSIKLSTLLCLQLHSLSSSCEVMGFLGGFRKASELMISRYKPCRTSKQSRIMCEMCPVSQVEQALSLSSENLDLLGWFHSHPLFPPNPSRQDIETQSEMQLQFTQEGQNNYFVGFILGCVEMKFKCIFVQKGVPFEINVSVVVDDIGRVSEEIQEVLEIIKINSDFDETIQKFYSSAEELLAKFEISQPITQLLGLRNL